ncbi:MAG: hypothetical protein RIF41_01985 [Polyangiaceae bacterium]
MNCSTWCTISNAPSGTDCRSDECTLRACMGGARGVSAMTVTTPPLRF